MSGNDPELKFVRLIRSSSADRRKFFEYLCRDGKGQRFGNGKEGLKLYEFFYEVVKKVGTEEAVKEYQQFFLPMVDEDLREKAILYALEAQPQSNSTVAVSTIGQLASDPGTSGIAALKETKPPPRQKKPWWQRLLG